MIKIIILLVLCIASCCKPSYHCALVVKKKYTEKHYENRSELLLVGKSPMILSNLVFVEDEYLVVFKNKNNRKEIVDNKNIYNNVIINKDFCGVW